MNDERNAEYPTMYRSSNTPQPLSPIQRLGRVLLATGVVIGALIVFAAMLRQLLGG